MKKKLVLPIVATLLLFITPTITFSEPSADTVNGNTGITYECGDGPTAGNCTFKDVIDGTMKVINWGVSFALFFSVIVIAYAGFMYLRSGTNPGERSKANAMLQKVAIGIVLVIAAWLIVNLITTTLLNRPFSSILN